MSHSLSLSLSLHLDYEAFSRYNLIWAQAPNNGFQSYKLISDRDQAAVTIVNAPSSGNEGIYLTEVANLQVSYHARPQMIRFTEQSQRIVLLPRTSTESVPHGSPNELPVRISVDMIHLLELRTHSRNILKESPGPS